MSKWLKKYTRIKYLYRILEKNSLFLGHTSSWDDHNDRALIEIYKQLKGAADIRVTCLTSAPDRFHFWQVFGDKECGACLWFDRDEMERGLRRRSDLEVGDVSYFTRDQLKKKCIVEQLPFAKRAQYEDEREFRILRIAGQSGCKADEWLEFEPTWLKRIYLNSWLHSGQFSALRDDISVRLVKRFSHVSVSQNKVHRDEKWIEAASLNFSQM